MEADLARQAVAVEDEVVMNGDLIELRGNIGRIFEEITSSRKSASGVVVSPETALSCTAVLAAVRVLAESIAAMPLNVMRRRPDGGSEIATDQHLHEVLAYQPNSWMTSFEFKELMMSWLLLWGNAYAYIKGGKKGGVTELIPLHPSRMEVRRLTNGRLRYYYTRPTAPDEPPQTKPDEYAQGEIFSIRWLSGDGVTGYVPVSLSKDAIGLARAMEIYSGAFFGNGARGGTYIKVTQPQKPEALARFKQQWNEAHQGPENAFKTVVMPFGFEKMEEAVRNDWNQTLETRRYAVEEVARCYRVPLHMLGDVKSQPHSTVEQSAIDFVTFSLIPWCRRWEQACRRDLVVDDAKYYCQFDVNSLMAGDYAARSQFLREMFNMAALDVDELRSAIGYNPLPGGAGKKRFIQVNMQLLDAFTVENPTGQKPQPTTPAGEPAPEQPAADEQVQEPSRPEDQTRAACEVVFQTTLRRLADVEAEGIIERRNKPEKLTAWFEQVQSRMRDQLRESAGATGRNIDDFVVGWVNRSKDLLLECHRSGKKYEEAIEGWCDKHLQ